MIEKIILDYLNSMLDEECTMERQTQNGNFVVIEKLGGGSENYLLKAHIAIQSCANSLYDAALLNGKVIKAMEKIIELPVISSCSLDSDYNFTDISTKKYRYQAVFDLVYYREG